MKNILTKDCCIWLWSHIQLSFRNTLPSKDSLYPPQLDRFPYFWGSRNNCLMQSRTETYHTKLYVWENPNIPVFRLFYQRIVTLEMYYKLGYYLTINNKKAIELWKKLVRCYVWSVALYSSETWPLKIGAEIFGGLWIVVLEKNGEDKIVREIN